MTWLLAAQAQARKRTGPRQVTGLMTNRTDYRLASMEDTNRKISHGHRRWNSITEYITRRRVPLDTDGKSRKKHNVVPVTPADCVVKSVYVRDIPFEVSDESIVSVLSTYGKVYSVKSVYHKEFPAICTGTRTVRQ